MAIAKRFRSPAGQRVNLHLMIDQIDDPVARESTAAVDPRHERAVFLETRIGDLDDQGNVDWLRMAF